MERNPALSFHPILLSFKSCIIWHMLHPWERSGAQTKLTEMHGGNKLLKTDSFSPAIRLIQVQFWSLPHSVRPFAVGPIKLE